MGDRRIRHAAASDLHPHAARSLGRKSGRPHAGDPAADRSIAAIGHETSRARRAHRLDRLRRDSSRRRHTDGIDHWWLRRAGAGVAEDALRGPAQGASHRRSRRRHQRWRRRRHTAPRSRLRRRLARRGRHERRQDRRRPIHRSAGHRGGAPVRTPGARRPVGTGRSRNPRTRGAAANDHRRHSSVATRRRTSVKEILIATTNPGKLKEIAGILTGVPIRLLTLNDLQPIVEPEETGTTFAENARLKARYYSSATGLVSVADDSGIEIDALDKAPGVHSARWHGTDYPTKFRKIQELFRERGVTGSTARFVCSVALADGESLLYETAGKGERWRALGVGPQRKVRKDAGRCKLPYCPYKN